MSLGRFYQYFWFYTEFWLTPEGRRPYTFIFRDWIYTHVWQFVILLIVYLGLNIWWLVINPVPAGIVMFFCGMLLAHLVWGTKWIENQQEEPAFLG